MTYAISVITIGPETATEPFEAHLRACRPTHTRHRMQNAEIRQPPEWTLHWDHSLTRTLAQLRRWRFGYVAGAEHAALAVVHLNTATPQDITNAWRQVLNRHAQESAAKARRHKALQASATTPDPRKHLDDNQARQLVNQHRQAAGKEPYTAHEWAERKTRSNAARAAAGQRNPTPTTRS